MIRQWVCVDIWCRWLERDYLLVNKILNFVLEVDTILSIMPYTIGMISTSQVCRILNYIHGFGPHKVDVSDRSQWLVQLCSAFNEHSEVP